MSADAPSIRGLLFHVNNVFHTRINFLLVAESVFFAAVSQVWATDDRRIALVLSVLGIALTVLLWYPTAMLFERSKVLTTDLIEVDPVYAKYMRSVASKPIVSALLTHALPATFLVGWILVLLAVCAR